MTVAILVISPQERDIVIDAHAIVVEALDLLVCPKNQHAQRSTKTRDAQRHHICGIVVTSVPLLTFVKIWRWSVTIFSSKSIFCPSESGTEKKDYHY